jgi:arylsulfatase A
MVGVVMRTLDELKLRENTLIILTSDNSGMLNQGDRRVPFFGRWPAKIEEGSVSDQLVYQIDRLSTFAVLTGSDTRGPDSLGLLPSPAQQA